MGRSLFLCNSVYQVLVAVWLKSGLFKDKEADIVLSDHMNGFKIIARNTKNTGLFNEVYTVESKKYVNNLNKSARKQIAQCFELLRADKKLLEFVALEAEYDELFVANFDFFTDVLFNVLKRKNKNLMFNIFEDGISTYCSFFENFYKRHFISRFIKHCVGAKVMYGEISSCFVFNPSLMDWKPCENIIQIPKIDEKDTVFLEKINTIFGYEDLEDTYEEKYIFFEESFYADTGYMEDVELVNRIADAVGKDNLLIKIHPRNPENRFEKLGYKTNKNTAIPWEVIALNKEIKDKVLLSIASTSIVNSNRIINGHCKGCSLLNLLSEKPLVLKTDLSEKVIQFYNSVEGCEVIEK